MQKHNKYLVWTIWIATIAFIGAGFVGWGSYDIGGKASKVAKVGDIEIKRSKLNMAYSNLYSKYNEMFQGQFDEAKAKEMGLLQQAFATVATQAKILNYAKDMGVIVSDEELAQALKSIKAFQDKEGNFDRKAYDMYLQSRRLTAKTFEETFRDELTINKLLKLMNLPTLPLEEESIGEAINVADRIAYKVLTQEDVNLTITDADLKHYWEAHKSEYMTPQQYTLAIVWTNSDNVSLTDEEIKNFYETNSFNYTDATGKQLTLDEAKERVTQDLKLKKTKKSAQKAYIAFKKGERQNDEILILPQGDARLSQEIWNALTEKEVGDILKPKVVKDRYATVKLVKVVEPQEMDFPQAKPLVMQDYQKGAKQKALQSLAENVLKDMNKYDAKTTDFVTLNHFDNLQPLNREESLQFLQKLFTSLKEKGIINVSNKVVVYSVVEQKLLPVDENQKKLVKTTAEKLKNNVFESNFIRLLDNKYPTEVYMGGLTN